MGESNLKDTYHRLLAENKDRLAKDVEEYVEEKINPVSTNPETAIQDSMYASAKLNVFTLNQRMDLLIDAIDEVMAKK